MRLAKFFLSLLLSLTATSATLLPQQNTLEARTVPETALKLVYQFPTGKFGENLAVRSNGKILVTIIGAPEVWQVDPTTSTANVLYRFSVGNSVLGITEYSPDIFAVAVGNFDQKTITGQAGSWSLWTIDLTKSPLPTVSRITTLPSAVFLNGLTSTTTILFAADSKLGLIYQINPHTGTLVSTYANPALNPNSSASISIGVNGIQVHSSYVYFDNSGQAPMFARIPLSPTTGLLSGPPQTIVAQPTFPVNPTYHGFDDFTFDSAGNAWMATNPSGSIVRITAAGRVDVIAGQGPTVAGVLKYCTSVKFGRGGGDRRVLYINGNQIGAGGRLYALDTAGL